MARDGTREEDNPIIKAVTLSVSGDAPSLTVRFDRRSGDPRPAKLIYCVDQHWFGSGVHPRLGFARVGGKTRLTKPVFGRLLVLALEAGAEWKAILGRLGRTAASRNAIGTFFRENFDHDWIKSNPERALVLFGGDTKGGPARLNAGTRPGTLVEDRDAAAGWLDDHFALREHRDEPPLPQHLLPTLRDEDLNQVAPAEHASRLRRVAEELRNAHQKRRDEGAAGYDTAIAHLLRACRDLELPVDAAGTIARPIEPLLATARVALVPSHASPLDIEAALRLVLVTEVALLLRYERRNRASYELLSAASPLRYAFTDATPYCRWAKTRWLEVIVAAAAYADASQALERVVGRHWRSSLANGLARAEREGTEPRGQAGYRVASTLLVHALAAGDRSAIEPALASLQAGAPDERQIVARYVFEALAAPSEGARRERLGALASAHPDYDAKLDALMLRVHAELTRTRGLLDWSALWSNVSSDLTDRVR